MTGSVDFRKEMIFWYQDKWSGSFPMKLYIIKDVPNTNFQQIILENSKNKAVTKGKDAQEKSNDNGDLESLVLLLKCLKIMENATFLSMDNQSHLLEMKGNLNHQGSSRTITKLIISVINILSATTTSSLYR